MTNHRMFFGGNLLCQSVFVQLSKDRPESIRLVCSNGFTLKQVVASKRSTAETLR